jgi:hypothetical protein
MKAMKKKKLIAGWSARLTKWLAAAGRYHAVQA